MSELIRIGSFPHLSAISKESMAEKIVELENRNKELEAEKEELEGPHTIEHEWTHEQFNSMFEKLSMMAVRISDKEVKKITMTCESDSQEVKWCATCKEEQSK